MRRIWGYLFGACLGPAGIGLLAYSFVFLINLVFQLAEFAIRKQIPPLLLGRLLLLSLPRVFLITVPMAVLLGILVGMGRLSADSEVTALRASGVSYPQMLPPLLGLGLAGAVVAAGCSLWLLPEASYRQHRLNADLFLAGDLAAQIQPRVFHEQIPGLLLYADEVDSGGLRDVLLFRPAHPGGGEMTLARRARIEPFADGSLQIHLQDGETHITDANAVRYERRAFRDQMVSLPPDEGVASIVATLRGPLPRTPREMGTRQLWRALRLPAAAPGGLDDRDRARGEIELHRRLALPAATLVFALLGLPLGVVTRRGGRSSGFAVSLLVLLVYWLLFSGGENLARSGAVRAATVLWTPNALFLVLALVLLGWMARDRQLPRWLQRLRSRRRRLPEAAPPSAPARGRRRRSREPRGFPGRIDRYVTSQYVRMLSLVLASFVLIHLLGDLRALLDDITENDVAGATVVRYFAYASPSMLVNALPLATLLATLLALGILARNNEITAMQAAGISLYRVSAPLLLVGVLLGSLQLVASESVLPEANRVASELRAQIRGSRTFSSFGLRNWIFGEERRLYNFASYSESRDEFLGVSIYQLTPDRHGIQYRLEADAARYRKGVWEMERGWERAFEQGVERYRRFEFETMRLPETPGTFREEIRTADQMSHTELQAHIHGLQSSGYDVQELRVALHERFSMSAVPPILILLGLPFSFRAGRRGSLAGVGLALVVAIVFYFVLAGFRQLGGLGFLPPVLAAWSPDLVFAGIGAYRLLSLDA